jgi:arylsulfatase A-like enzyme
MKDSGVLLSETHAESSRANASATSLLLLATWFGILTGLLEGAGLLIFQRVNWAQWGRVIHVSKQILWISPLVDLLFFLILALLVWLASWLSTRIPSIRVLCFLLSFLAVYDWLTLTNRLYHRACVLLALGVAVAFTRWVGSHQLRTVRFWQKSTPWLVAFFLLVFVGIQGGRWLREQHAVDNLPTAAPGSPNVLVIVVDTLRADHLSSYGYGRATSPQLDQLAKNGVLFQNAVAPCSWTLPSHASLLTGRYPFEHGLKNVQPWLGWGKKNLNGFATLGEALQRSGYRTGTFSANRIFFTRNVGLGRGFIHFEDYFDSPSDSFIRTVYGREFARLYLNRTEKSEVTRAFRFFGFDAWLDKDTEGSGDYGGAYAKRKRAEAVNREVLQWIRRDQQRPFFAFLNYLDVHYAYGGPYGYPKPEWDHGTPIDEYDAGVKYVDDYIRRLLRELQREGLAEKTIVVITSDHGESLGEHGMNYHGISLYWNLIHVPLIISYPGHLPEGLRVATPVSNVAIPATVMSLLGGVEQNVFPGPALNVLWDSSKSGLQWPDPVSELGQNSVINTQDRLVKGRIPTAADGDMESLVTSRWHLIIHQKSGEQLYDWTVDPGESEDLIHTPDGQTTALKLKAQLQAATAH